MRKAIVTEKPEKCPKCGHKVAEVLYGMPAFSDELQQALDNGDIILGGCCISENSHDFECTHCHKKFWLENGIASDVLDLTR